MPMKKQLAAAAASVLLLTGCGSDVKTQSNPKVVIPSDVVIKAVMENQGYQTAQIGNLETDGYSMFTASNGKTDDEYDGFLLMRSTDADDLDSKTKSQSAQKDNLIVFVVKNDPTYGNVMITGTETAIKTAGIHID